MNVKLLVDKHYPASWVMSVPPILAGTIVSVVEATNLPRHDKQYWIDTPDLQDDAYGILLRPGEYEIV